MAQWKRAGPITQRSVDRNYALLKIFLVYILACEDGGRLGCNPLFYEVPLKFIE